MIGDAQLFLGDCRDILPTLGPVDAVMTDPPYGIGFKYLSHNDTPKGYGQWMWLVISTAEALCSPGSPIFVWQAQANAKNWAEWFPRDWRVFVQAKNFVQIRKVPMNYAYEPVLVWWTSGEIWWASKDANAINRDWFIANTAGAVSDTESLARGHPCPRQIDVMEYVVGTWVRPGGIVLDPFMGSGTTGVACANLGRCFIGIEIEKRYFEIACERIRRAYESDRLGLKPKLIEQEKLL